ncbi:MAG: hypothetical protein AMXMBFR82_48680 [Candidatus Hydrogenedentota bacterium]
MAATISSVQTNLFAQYQSTQLSFRQNQESATALVRDSLDLGQSGPLSTEDAINIVTERSLNKLLSVVNEARAELGIPEGSVLDISPEATAGRIADFALGFFDVYREQHSELGENEARQQFAEFIGGAIGQGIEEARGILGALQALNPDVDNKIETIADLIQQRLDAFVSGVE